MYIAYIGYKAKENCHREHDSVYYMQLTEPNRSIRGRIKKKWSSHAGELNCDRVGVFKGPF